MNKTFATFCEGAEEGPLPGEHPGAHSCCCRRTGVSRATMSFSATCRPATSTTSAAGATGCAGWRITAVRSACRWTSTPSSTSCRRTRTSPRQWKARARAGVAARAADLAPHAREPDADRVQLRVQRPAVRREARHGEGLQAQPAQAQRGPRAALERWDEDAIAPARRTASPTSRSSVWAAPEAGGRRPRRLPADRPAYGELHASTTTRTCSGRQDARACRSATG